MRTILIVAAAEVFISSDCPRCKKLVEMLHAQLGDKFDRAVIIKDVEKEEDSQRDLLRLNFLSTPVVKVDGRTWALDQLSESAIRQVCCNLTSKV